MNVNGTCMSVVCRCRGVVALDIDLRQMDIDQCANGSGAFAHTHRCRETTEVSVVL